MLAGTDALNRQYRDLEYVRDLGLVALDPPVRIANPIYAEVVPRDLTSDIQEDMTEDTIGYLAEDTLDIERLLKGFQDFYRLNSEHWEERFEYKEAGQQLLLQAYLQRVVNGSGHLHREYATGRGRTDLLVSWPLDNGEQRRIVIECKVRRARNSMNWVIAQGIEQIGGYMNRCGTAEGHLVVFESDASKTWDERIFRREEAGNGTMVVVWGC